MSIEVFADELGEMMSPHVADDEKLMQKGLMLYRQGMVSQLRHDGEDIVRATVQDVIPVKVELDLEFPGLSECSCPAEGICRHMLAVFFAEFARKRSVTDWVEEWRAPVQEVNQITQWGLKRAKDLVKANGVLQPDYERWVQSMEESFAAIVQTKKHSNPYVVSELFQIYEKRIMAGSPTAPEWHLLYQLIANVVSFKLLAALSEELGHTEDIVKRTYLPLLHQLSDDAERLMARIGQRPLPFDFDGFIEKFTADTLDLLTCTHGLEYERIYLYRLLWTDFLKKKAWREAEIVRISERLKEIADWQSPFPLVMALIHLHVLLEDDERVFELMEAVEERSLVPYMIYWLDSLSDLKAWRRAGLMVDALVARLRPFLETLSGYQACAGFTRLAMKAISPYCVEMRKAEVYERALMQTLPYSFYDYEHLLFTKGQYDRWGELYSFVGIPFSDLPKERVKVVEKEQPEVLLAILHQSVQHEIEMKNRSSYREAVRHLKKLRTLYKKQKRGADWEFFFGTLLEKTKRLRAFQEECKRSKLIDA